MLRDAVLYIMRFPRFMYALWRVYRLPKPIITIFGGRNVPPHHHYYKQAFELTKRLSQLSLSIITGGGPGIMDAALCGAKLASTRKNALGIEVFGVDEDFSSSCGAPGITLSNFALRKRILIYYSAAFVVFPGGIGTLDELAEVLNLIKTNKIPQVPIILFDSDYWKPFVDWVYKATSKGLLLPGFERSYIILDDIDEMYDYIFCHLVKSNKL